MPEKDSLVPPYVYPKQFEKDELAMILEVFLKTNFPGEMASRIAAFLEKCKQNLKNEIDCPGPLYAAVEDHGKAKIP